MKLLNQIYSHSKDVVIWTFDTQPRIIGATMVVAMVAFETTGPFPGFLREPNLAHLKARVRVLGHVCLINGLGLLYVGLRLLGADEAAEQTFWALLRQESAFASECYGYRAAGSPDRVVAMNVLREQLTKDPDAALKDVLSHLRELGADEEILKSIQNCTLNQFQGGVCFGMCVEVARRIICDHATNEKACKSFEYGAGIEALSYQAYYKAVTRSSPPFQSQVKTLYARENVSNDEVEKLIEGSIDPSYRLIGLKLDTRFTLYPKKRSLDDLCTAWDQWSKDAQPGVFLVWRGVGRVKKTHSSLYLRSRHGPDVVFDPKFGSVIPCSNRWLTDYYEDKGGNLPYLLVFRVVHEE